MYIRPYKYLFTSTHTHIVKCRRCAPANRVVKKKTIKETHLKASLGQDNHYGSNRDPDVSTVDLATSPKLGAVGPSPPKDVLFKI